MRHDLLLEGRIGEAFLLVLAACGIGRVALFFGGCFEADRVGKLVAEAFEGCGYGTRLVFAVLAGDRLVILAAAQTLNVGDKAVDRALDETTDGKIEADDDGEQYDEAAGDHEHGLFANLCSHDGRGDIDEDDPAGVQARQVERIDEAFELRAVFAGDAIKLGCRLVGDGGLIFSGAKPS